MQFSKTSGVSSRDRCGCRRRPRVAGASRAGLAAAMSKPGHSASGSCKKSLAWRWCMPRRWKSVRKGRWPGTEASLFLYCSIFVLYDEIAKRGVASGGTEVGLVHVEMLGEPVGSEDAVNPRIDPLTESYSVGGVRGKRRSRPRREGPPRLPCRLGSTRVSRASRNALLPHATLELPSRVAHKSTVSTLAVTNVKGLIVGLRESLQRSGTICRPRPEPGRHPCKCSGMMADAPRRRATRQTPL